MRWALLLVCSVACIDEPGVITDELTLDWDQYVGEVEPALTASCANPSCHGVPVRPLELFGVHQHRLDPELVYADEPLTQTESELNLSRIAEFVVAPPDAADSDLLRKPLAEDAGGTGHVGGVQFEDAEDATYRLVLDWLLDSQEMER